MLQKPHIPRQNNTVNHFEAIENYQKQALSKNQSGVFKREYLNSHLALYDVVFSLHQFLSHKEKIGVIRRGSSVCESLISQFLKQQIPIQYKDDKQNTFEYIESIDRETNFVIWASENEVTGENIFSDKDCLEIHTKLSAKRIFSIQIMLPSRSLNHDEIFKNQYAVVVDAADLFNRKKSSVYFSEKLKAPSLIGPLQYLEIDGPQEKIDRRIWPDRKLFSFPKVSGFAVKQVLLQSTTLSATDLFAPAELPSWITESWKNWWLDSSQSEYLRGLLVVSQKCFQQVADLDLKIAEIAKQLEIKSNWPNK